MTVEYIILGAVIILVGVGQIYFRHFVDTDDDGRGGREVPNRRGNRGGRLWQGWTAILGFIGIALGIALVVVGALGRG
jgi:hypothetical protein